MDLERTVEKALNGGDMGRREALGLGAAAAATSFAGCSSSPEREKDIALSETDYDVNSILYSVEERGKDELALIVEHSEHSNMDEIDSGFYRVEEGGAKVQEGYPIDGIKDNRKGVTRADIGEGDLSGITDGDTILATSVYEAGGGNYVVDASIAEFDGGRLDDGDFDNHVATVVGRDELNEDMGGYLPGEEIQDDLYEAAVVEDGKNPDF